MKISKDKLKQIVREELKDLVEAGVDENRALDNAIANRDANRANRKGIEQYQDLYFGLQKLISKVSKNNKVKGIILCPDEYEPPSDDIEICPDINPRGGKYIE